MTALAVHRCPHCRAVLATQQVTSPRRDRIARVGGDWTTVVVGSVDPGNYAKKLRQRHPAHEFRWAHNGTIEARRKDDE